MSSDQAPRVSDERLKELVVYAEDWDKAAAPMPRDYILTLDLRDARARIAALEAQAGALEAALIDHRADLHNYSKRPFPTCRQSAKALGIDGTVPDSCARGDTDKTALENRPEPR